MYEYEQAETTEAVRDRDPNVYLSDALDASAEVITMLEKAADNLLIKLAPIMEDRGNLAVVTSAEREGSPQQQPPTLLVQRVVDQRVQLKNLLSMLSDLDCRCRL